MDRLKSHRDFVRVLKRRRKVTEKDIVVHFLVYDDSCCGYGNGHNTVEAHAQLAGKAMEAMKGSIALDAVRQGKSGRRLGLAVSKNVGNAVARNHVKRRFRVLAKAYEGSLPQHCDIVMRAKPSAARADFSSLDAQVAQLFADVASKAASKGKVRKSRSDLKQATVAEGDRS